MTPATRHELQQSIAANTWASEVLRQAAHAIKACDEMLWSLRRLDELVPHPPDELLVHRDRTLRVLPPHSPLIDDDVLAAARRCRPAQLDALTTYLPAIHRSLTADGCEELTARASARAEADAERLAALPNPTT